MCGIFGFSSRHPVSSSDNRIQAVFNNLHHRGPDDRGFEAFPSADGYLVLGHTRLSILDLSSAGHQPMHSIDKRYSIVFNGEIYNYRELRQDLKNLGHFFHTNSDTEVLLAAWSEWGIKALRRITGMFAFAVIDHAEQVLTLARDGFGIKPLFYYLEGNQILFASEISALISIMPAKPELNLQQAYDYLVYGSYDNQPYTFYDGINHLAPGHSLQLNLKELSCSLPVRWWWPAIKERKDLSFNDAANQLREMFLDSVRLHLRSDVPLGAALSGGLDSSAIVCAMRHLEPDLDIHTFSFVARGTEVDEERWVDIVNQHVGAIPHKIEVSPEEFAADLDDMIKTQGEPFGSTSIYAQYRVFKAARDAGITVTLDGQGADELLAGYSGYPQAYIRSLVDQRQFTKVGKFLKAWADWPGRGYEQALRVLVQPMIPDALRGVAYRLAGKNPNPTWLSADILSAQGVIMAPPVPLPSASTAHGRRLVETLRSALTGNGITALLRHGDRNSMRWSVESRVPFLTVDLAEFLLSLPESYLLSEKGETKHIFRAAMRGIVPDEILDRRDKIGFATPEKVWLKQQHSLVNEWMANLSSLTFLNTTSVYKAVDAIVKENQPSSEQAWRLINYCRWVGNIKSNIATK